MFAVIVPVIPVLISRLRESYPFFDSFCSTVSYIFHNDTFQTLLVIFLVANIAFLFFKFLHHSFCVGSLDKDRNKSFLYQFIVDVFFERIDPQSDENERGVDDDT